MTDDRKNPFVFVVGCPRSGTTLLQRMLDNHPSLAVANDTHFVWRCLERRGPEFIPDALAGRDVPLTTKLFEGVLEYHRFPRLGISDEQAEKAAERSTTYSGFVGELYTEFASQKGKPLGGEKSPDFVRRLSILHGLFPHTKIVHIVRDGRDVALSVFEWTEGRKGPAQLDLWRESRVAATALWWRRMVATGRRDGAQLGSGSYFEVMYEDLTADPEAILRRIAGFLNLPFAEQMLRYYEDKVRSDPKLSAKSNWLPPTTGLRDWRTQMPAADVELFEALTGDLLEELGLERRFPNITSAIAEAATTYVSKWEAATRSRGSVAGGASQ